MKDEPEYAVGSGMLGPEVDLHVLDVLLRLRGSKCRVVVLELGHVVRLGELCVVERGLLGLGLEVLAVRVPTGRAIHAGTVEKPAKKTEKKINRN